MSTPMTKKPHIELSELLLDSVPATADTHRLFLKFKVAATTGQYNIATKLREELAKIFRMPGSQLAILLGGSAEHFEAKFNFGRIDEDSLAMVSYCIDGQVWSKEHFSTTFRHTSYCGERFYSRRGLGKNVRQVERLAAVNQPGYEAGFLVSVDLAEHTLKVESTPSDSKIIGPNGWATNLLAVSFYCQMWLQPPATVPPSTENP